MKSSLIKIFFAIAIPVLSNAQPIVKNAEKFSIGKVYHFQLCDVNNIDTSLKGANQVWDYSKISLLNDTFSMKIVDPKSTPYHNQFPNATLVEEGSDGTYVYAIQQDSTSNLEGYVSTADNLEIEYPKNQLFMKRPLTFGDFYNDTYRNKYKAGGFDFSGGGNTTIDVNGYGELKLPHKTYSNTTRVTLIQDQLDTLIRFGTEVRSKTVTHLWFSENNPAPLFRVVTYSSSQGTTISSSILVDKKTTSTQPSIIEGQNVSIYPNPANTNIYIDVSRQDYVSEISIVNLNGQVILNHLKPGNIDVSILNNGFYFLQVQTKNDSIENHKIIMSLLFRYLAIITITNFSFLAASAQTEALTQTVRGRITDLDTKAPLLGATVVIVGSNPLKGATTNIDGNFVIENVTVGRVSFKISSIGYEETYVNEVAVSSGMEAVLNVPIKESITALKAVDITPDEEPQDVALNEMTTVSAQRLTVESTSRIAAGINDPGRTIQSYAGVAATDDENNEIVVRGNSPRGMLWRMEGVEIPNPNHFSDGDGGTGGGVSALSTKVLDDSDFLTGAFSAEYGNALSSVFDLRLRNGNSQKREYSFQIGVLGIQASAEGPFSKKSNASYLVNYRYSTTSLLNNMGFSIGESDVFPAWQDLSFNVNIPTKKLGRIKIWGLGGISSSAQEAETDTSKWMYRSDAFNSKEKHLLGVVGLSHFYLLKNNKTYIKSVASVSRTNSVTEEDSINYAQQSTQLLDESFGYKTFTATSFVNHKFSAKHIARFGAIYTYQAFDLTGKEYNWDTYVYESKIQQTGSTDRIQAFAQWKYRINPKLDLNTGVHYTHLTINNDYVIEPRLGIKYKMNQKHSISYGSGLHSRVEPPSIYKAQQTLANGDVIYPNEKLKMSKAFHNVLGYNVNLGKNLFLKAEVYYQYLYDVPIVLGDTTGTKSSLNFGAGFTNETMVNEGTGRNYGLELTLNKAFSHNYYAMATISLFESKYTMPGFEERNTAYNSNYIYNLIGGKEFKVGKKKQDLIGANLRLIWRGGYKTIPVDLDASAAEGKDVRNYDNAFETKAPDYFRLDIGVNYRRNKPKWAWVFSIDIQNVTNRANVWDEYYSTERKQVEQIYMAGLIPVINYKIEF